MSSQRKGIPLSYVPDDVGYRLIELPPDLQSLLEKDGAPILTIESGETSAILKTPNKAYALRQKNTSNALMLLSPQASSSDPEPSLAVISTIHETVELENVPDNTVAAGASKGAASKGKWHERFGKNR